MKILKHRLFSDDGTPVRFQLSPTIGEGNLIPRFLIIHSTEGRTLEGAVITLTNKKEKKSSHLVIGRDGTIVQLVPFNQVAWHAGDSSWKGLTNLNQYSIGIELDNAGPLKKTANGWQSPYDYIYPDVEVKEAVHKLDKIKRGWHIFPPQQIETCKNVAVALVREYGLADIAGHDDVSPGRKRDPGPAFPMDDFREEVMRLAKLPLP